MSYGDDSAGVADDAIAVQPDIAVYDLKTEAPRRFGDDIDVTVTEVVTVSAGEVSEELDIEDNGLLNALERGRGRAAAAGGRAMSRALSDNRPVPRRGLSRDEAAMYNGVSPTTLDKLVADGRMPQPRRIDGRKVWDIRSLDLHFDMLPIHDDAPQPANSWADA